ncbi:MAG: GTP 3',8-cyclase MoaA, partial [Chloroflexi bacterium]|nr:GTP 3',8-cyclase MoaA [Chloroflexota bacterium]
MTMVILPVLQDRFQRVHKYLRISVTDRCNFRCVYCMPTTFSGFLPRSQVLTFEEIARVVRVAAGLGVSRLKVTGGEPLVRRELPALIRSLRSAPGIEEITMTSNGVLLARYARELKDAGLDRINVSLDTLKPERFDRLARGTGTWQDVLAGIEAARAVGLEPVKINVVSMRGVNDDEALDFARLTVAEGWHVRFIELMPFPEEQNQDCHGGGLDGAYLPTDELRARIEAAYGPLESAELPGNGPARYFRVPGAAGSIGFISPVSEEHFCARCNR